VISPDLIKSRVVKLVYGYWALKAAAGALPRRSDIRWEELRGLASYVGMVDVLKDPLRFRIRFFGTQLVQWAGRDHTGSVIEEGTSGAERLVFDDYRSVVETRQPRYDERSAAWPGNGYHRFERIVAPLSSDGKTVDMLFGAIDPRASS
jgi:hypothetical protein